MMMLELDYMASFNQPYTDSDSRTLHFGGLTIFFLVVFVLLMPILLINLLVKYFWQLHCHFSSLLKYKFLQDKKPFNLILYLSICTIAAPITGPS